ncbi:amino acid ABC transporter permease [Paraburkholderia azotifigens]|uniref:Amino acid ABC transporter permease n=1 Tax=Paraburkholderia azotifigens TaxID=2057004 RepID=A0ABU9R8M8_9BURK
MMATTFNRWVRYNLFATPASSVVSVVAIPLTLYVAYLAAKWTFVQAHWSVISDNLPVLLVGTFPRDELWRAVTAGAVLSVLVGITLGLVLMNGRWKSAAGIGGLCVALALATLGVHQPALAGTAACLALIGLSRAGASFFPSLTRAIGLCWVVGLGAICSVLAPAGVSNWGGLLASVLVTAIATLLSIPLGILLAFGKNSRFPSVRIVCAGYVELVRSVPVISIVYWAWIIVPLVLPPQFHIADLVRGIAAFVLFYGAYTAEYVRAGIQGVSRGQSEAAQALGFNKLDENFIIVLPQALKAVIPALVGNVLDLFNNVPALFIIGLTDFLKAGQTVLANPQYSGSQYEVYIFLFAVYLAIGALISYVARRIELRMSRGSR